MVLVRHLVGAVLREERMRQGRTLRDVSERATISLGYLSEVERGVKEPSSECLASICTALELPLSSVLLRVGSDLMREERALSAVPGSGPDVVAAA
jgi:transcriptional regulator with XRE-family HTH domain